MDYTLNEYPDFARRRLIDSSPAQLVYSNSIYPKSNLDVRWDPEWRRRGRLHGMNKWGLYLEEFRESLRVPGMEPSIEVDAEDTRLIW